MPSEAQSICRRSRSSRAGPHASRSLVSIFTSCNWVRREPYVLPAGPSSASATGCVASLTSCSRVIVPRMCAGRQVTGERRVSNLRLGPKRCIHSARDLQRGESVSALSRPWALDERLGSIATAPDPPRSADHDEGDARLGDVARPGLDVLRRPVCARGRLERRPLSRRRPASGASSCATAAAGAAREGSRHTPLGWSAADIIERGVRH